MKYRVVRWFCGEPEVKEPAVDQIFVRREIAEKAKARLQADFPQFCFTVEEIMPVLGTLLVLPDALAAIKNADQTPMEFLGRHTMSNLEEIETVSAAGNLSFKTGLCISSFQKTRKNVELFVLTEVDQLRTTISLRNG